MQKQAEKPVQRLGV